MCDARSHGARLDAADKQWHLTSPTPYDPPLTYGGWSQGKALGLRIATLLHQRATEKTPDVKPSANADLAHLEFSSLDGHKPSKPVDGPSLGARPKKYKIVIHSSPYLRCIQTSTAVAAGIAQFQPPKDTSAGAATRLNVPQPAKERNGLLGTNPLAKSPRTTSPAVQPLHLLEPTVDPNLEVFPRPQSGPQKILLRIDAFLGEWLSPDYFEDITPPPNSTMMVAGAKADLLRRGDYVETQPTVHNSKGHFPGGWVKGTASATTNGRKTSEEGTTLAMGSLAQALPFRERASSQGSGTRHRSRSREHGTPALSTAHKVPSHIYDPPIPSYAVSPSDPIPRGYVSHARDACVDVDFQWDSMRAPQEWGDGGEFGDEWSTMHKRFRKGLAGMMQWYREHGAAPPQDQFAGFMFSERPSAPPHFPSDPGPKVDADVEDDEELVLILVTHGAGCNALLGAISNQPVLIDVGLAALSMAVRRDEPRRLSDSAMYQRRPSVVDPGMSSTYDMKLLASLDHLRPGVDPSKPPQPQSPAVIASPSLEYRRRFGGSGGANSPVNQLDSPFSIGEPIHSGWNSSLGSIRRSSTSGSSSRLLSNATGSTSPMLSTGLWSSLRAATGSDNSSDGRRSPGADMVLNFGIQQPKQASRSTSTTSTIPNVDGASSLPDSSTTSKEEDDNVAPLKSITATSRKNSVSGGLWAPKPQTTGNGLWGPPKLDDVYEHGRGPKRRWTMSERD